MTVCDPDEFVSEALDLPDFQTCVKECKESLSAVPGTEQQLSLEQCGGKQDLLVAHCFRAQMKL